MQYCKRFNGKFQFRKTQIFSHKTQMQFFVVVSIRFNFEFLIEKKVINNN